MAAATKAEMEKVVRRMLDEQNGANGATLEAIRRVSRLLTEQVIPKLAIEPGGEEAEEEEDEMTGAATRLAPVRRRTGPAADDDLDAGTAEGEDDTVVPPAVTEALEVVCRSLSPGQADALADLFTAMGSDLGEGGEREGEEGEEVEDEADGKAPDG